MKNTVLIFFVLYFAVAAVSIPGFIRVANLLAIFVQASFLFILSCGLTFVVMNGGIDFSVIGIMGISSIAGATLMKLGSHFIFIILAILSMIALGVGIGFINGLAVTKLKMPSFIATMGTHLIFYGIAIWYTKSASISDLPEAFIRIGQGRLAGIPMPVIVAFVLVFVASYLLHRSIFGFYLQAIGSNQNTARISGIPVEKTILKIFILSGVFASIASILMTARVASGIPMMGENMIMDIIAAVLIGGTSISGGEGSILGTLLGAILVITLNNSLYIVGLQWYVINIFKGVMVLAVAFLESRRKIYAG
jgi:ribose transport system permease protein